jgi:hypothetical protein
MTPGDPRTRLPAWLESAWLVRYLDRELTPPEMQWFEAYVLDKPELLTMIDSDNDLRDAIDADPTFKSLSDRSSTNLDQAESTKAQVKRSLTFERGLSVAASFALGISIGWFGSRVVLQSNRQATVVGNPTRVVYDTMRGKPLTQSKDKSRSPTPIIEQGEAHSPYIIVEVAVLIGAEDVELEIDGSIRAELTPSREGFVSFLVARNEIGKHKSAVVRYTFQGTPIPPTEISILTSKTGGIR